MWQVVGLNLTRVTGYIARFFAGHFLLFSVEFRHINLKQTTTASFQICTYLSLIIGARGDAVG